MGYYITPDGSYYEGQYVAEGSIEVPERPSLEHVWNNGWVLSIDLLELKFKTAIQALLDNEAKAKGYDTILSACSYASPGNPFQAESQSFVIWRSAVWSYCYTELDKVKNGTRPLPTIEQIISELPAR